MEPPPRPNYTPPAVRAQTNAARPPRKKRAALPLRGIIANDASPLVMVLIIADDVPTLPQARKRPGKRFKEVLDRIVCEKV
jgi:hypothetical protein